MVWVTDPSENLVEGRDSLPVTIHLTSAAQDLGLDKPKGALVGTESPALPGMLALEVWGLICHSGPLCCRYLRSPAWLGRQTQ